MNASICPCDEACPLDVPGVCQAPRVCCSVPSDCTGSGQVCAGDTCEPVAKSPGCWFDDDCFVPGTVEYQCEGAKTCDCADPSCTAQAPGMCAALIPGQCPARLPANGDRCAVDMQECAYGDDLRAKTCRTVASCTGGMWSVVAPTCEAVLQPGQDACPSSVLLGGDSCSVFQEVCDLGQGNACDCINCIGTCATPQAWHCFSPPGEMCPPIPPNLGQPCTLLDGSECDYGACHTQTLFPLICAHGLWVQGSMGCPGG